MPKSKAEVITDMVEATAQLMTEKPPPFARFLQGCQSYRTGPHEVEIHLRDGGLFRIRVEEVDHEETKAPAS